MKGLYYLYSKIVKPTVGLVLCRNQENLNENMDHTEQHQVISFLIFY